jgi:hypothetical protein
VGQFSITTAQIQNVALCRNIFQDLLNAGLQPLPGCRKLEGKGLVKLTIEFNQSLGDFSFHPIIIAGSSFVRGQNNCSDDEPKTGM